MIELLFKNQGFVCSIPVAFTLHQLKQVIVFILNQQVSIHCFPNRRSDTYSEIKSIINQVPIVDSNWRSILFLAKQILPYFYPTSALLRPCPKSPLFCNSKNVFPFSSKLLLFWCCTYLAFVIGRIFVCFNHVCASENSQMIINVLINQ